MHLDSWGLTVPVGVQFDLDMNMNAVDYYDGAESYALKNAAAAGVYIEFVACHRDLLFW